DGGRLLHDRAGASLVRPGDFDRHAADDGGAARGACCCTSHERAGRKCYHADGGRQLIAPELDCLLVSTMARNVILFTGPWADLPLEELAPKASEWGYQGLELCCWRDHFEVQRALSEDGYCQRKLDLLAKCDLVAAVVSNHRVGQAVADRVDARHQA